MFLNWLLKQSVLIFFSLFQRNSVMKPKPLFGNLNLNKGNNSNVFCDCSFFLIVITFICALWLKKMNIFAPELKPLGSETLFFNSQNSSPQWLYDRTLMRSSYDIQVIIWTFNEQSLQVRVRWDYECVFIFRSLVSL